MIRLLPELVDDDLLLDVLETVVLPLPVCAAVVLVVVELDVVVLAGALVAQLERGLAAMAFLHEQPLEICEASVHMSFKLVDGMDVPV